MVDGQEQVDLVGYGAVCGLPHDRHVLSEDNAASHRPIGLWPDV